MVNGQWSMVNGKWSMGIGNFRISANPVMLKSDESQSRLFIRETDPEKNFTYKKSNI